MMQSEFEKLTGVYVSSGMYQAIEQYYMDSDMDKQEFCKQYKNNQNGLAEKIQKYANQLQQTKLNLYDKALQQKEVELQQAMQQKEVELQQANAKIKKLKKTLEAEQEWEPYINESLWKDYDDRFQSCKHEAVDHGQLKQFIADAFGFRYGATKIITSLIRQEINRHGALRNSLCPPMERMPWYDSTDDNYILFTVRGYLYECVDGELYIVED